MSKLSKYELLSGTRNIKFFIICLSNWLNLISGEGYMIRRLTKPVAYPAIEWSFYETITGGRQRRVYRVSAPLI